MGFLPPELLKKKEKLIRAAHHYRNREAVSVECSKEGFPSTNRITFQNLTNLKKSTELIRYVIKYLNRYPAQYKDVFCAWLDFMKVNNYLKLHSL